MPIAEAGIPAMIGAAAAARRGRREDKREALGKGVHDLCPPVTPRAQSQPGYIARHFGKHGDLARVGIDVRLEACAALGRPAEHRTRTIGGLRRAPDQLASVILVLWIERAVALQDMN
jgi:hypothetical protein